jgi:hypothetical protein
MQKFVTIIFLLIILAVQTNGQDELKYCNSRFGFCFSYPAFLISAPPPVSGDGIRIYDKKGFFLAVSGINNTLGDTFESELQIQFKNIGTMTYGRRGSNWFAIAGFKDNKIVYIKEFIDSGSINRIYIEYPQDKKDKYDKITDTISRSFKPGNLTGNH